MKEVKEFAMDLYEKGCTDEEVVQSIYNEFGYDDITLRFVGGVLIVERENKMNKLELTDEFDDTLFAHIQTIECDDDEDYKVLSIGTYSDCDNIYACLNKGQIEELIRYLQKAKEELL